MLYYNKNIHICVYYKFNANQAWEFLSYYSLNIINNNNIIIISYDNLKTV